MRPTIFAGASGSNEADSLWVAEEADEEGAAGDQEEEDGVVSGASAAGRITATA